MSAREILAFCMTVAAMAVPSAAAAQEATGDIIVMRKAIEVEKTSGISLPIVDTLVGPTYGWYSACSGRSQVLACVAFAEKTNAVSIADNTSCAKPQNVLHNTLMRAQSILQLGGDLLTVPGTAPADECASGVNLGYGYSCSYNGDFTCIEVDRKNLSGRYADPGECTKAAKTGFESVFAQFGLTSGGTGVNPATACLGGTVYGREESCSWKEGGTAGMTMEMKEECYSIDPATLIVQAAPLSACRNAKPSPSPYAANMLRSRTGLLSPTEAPELSCTGDDRGVLSTRLISDVTRSLSNGYREREINSSFTCKMNGVDVPYHTHCSVAVHSWIQMIYRVARGAGTNGSNMSVASGGPRVDEGIWQFVLNDVYW